jgi:nucleotide-binding universal stress UspA family protein
MPGTIVVGVDGSPASREALRWAAQEAELRNARLVAVHAWSFVPPPPLGDPGMLAMPAGDLAGQLEAENEAVHAELDAAVDESFPGGPPVEIEQRLIEGGPADVLESEARSADLLVVGSHGRSGLKAALLGSVSRHVVDHATCPVVVVKASGS